MSDHQIVFEVAQCFVDVNCPIQEHTTSKLLKVSLLCRREDLILRFHSGLAS